jgi:hypothetical protein
MPVGLPPTASDRATPSFFSSPNLSVTYKSKYACLQPLFLVCNSNRLVVADHVVRRGGRLSHFGLIELSEKAVNWMGMNVETMMSCMCWLDVEALDVYFSDARLVRACREDGIWSDKDLAWQQESVPKPQYYSVTSLLLHYTSISVDTLWIPCAFFCVIFGTCAS